MKKTKNCSIGVRKLQEFYRQIELNNSIIDKFLDKNFYQNICGFNFDELCDSFLKEKERIVNKYKNQFDFDINNIIKLFQNHTFYKSILGMDLL